MNHFSRWVVRHYKLIIAICALLLIPGFYGMAKTSINYDLLTYLPSELNSVQGQTILEKDFRIAGNAFLLVENQRDWQVERLKKEIADIEGVEKVIWIDDWADITIPKDFVPQKVVDQFYDKNATMMQIQFKEGSGSDQTVQAIGEIKALLDHSTYLGGTSAVISDLRILMDHERIVYLVVAVLLLFLILSLTLPSTLVPLLFLLSIGTAIVYNLGSNLWLGEISYVTSAIAAVLQLGVTMDFSIFLMHRFQEEKEKQENKEEAMAQAIEKTFVAIGASSLTAIAGFLSLGVMQIGLGKDMGLVMAKGVALGVIVSLTLLPALLLACDGLITRFQHRIFLPSFKWTAHLVSKRYVPLFLLMVLLLVPAYYGKENVKVFYNVSDALPKDISSIHSTDYIKQRFGSADTLYLITPAGEEWKAKRVAEQVSKMPGVVNVVSPADYSDVAVPQAYVPEELRRNFTNGKYDYTIIQSEYHPADPESSQLIKNIRQASAAYFKESYLSGESPLTDDMIKLVGTDQKAVDKWSVGAILAILAVAFTSLTLPILLVLVIELAIFINLGIPYYTGTTIPFIAVMTIGAIQLGSCVNYAILLVSRYKEELVQHDKFTAIRNAVQGTGGSIVTSALALSFATVGVGFISKVEMIGSLSQMIARGAFISMFTILFFLPPLLLICEKLVGFTSLRWPRKHNHEGGKELEEAFQ